MIITPYISRATHHGIAYIAGSEDGIVSINAQPVQREIILFDARDLNIVDRTTSLKNGHYLFMGLDPNKRYLIMCRDYEQQYEPCVYDHVQPATDLTLAEQQQLWESWQHES